jgi:hypothetical protein
LAGGCYPPTEVIRERELASLTSNRAERGRGGVKRAPGILLRGLFFMNQLIVSNSAQRITDQFRLRSGAASHTEKRLLNKTFLCTHYVLYVLQSTVL